MPGVSSLENVRGSHLDFHRNQLVLFCYMFSQDFPVFVTPTFTAILPYPTFPHSVPLLFSPKECDCHSTFISCLVS